MVGVLKFVGLTVLITVALAVLAIAFAALAIQHGWWVVA